jgi:hypothetical protein
MKPLGRYRPPQREPRGLGHVGCFAGDYRVLFGELPFVTSRRRSDQRIADVGICRLGSICPEED